MCEAGCEGKKEMSMGRERGILHLIFREEQLLGLVL